ncbi:unnamed protein product [Brassica oleracea var. botrytis]
MAALQMSREWIGIQQFPPATQSKLLEILGKFKEEDVSSLTVLVMGKGGVGKSSTVNSVIGEKAAAVSTFQSEGLRPSLVSRSRSGFTLNIIDTPGLIEGGYVNDQAVNLIKRFLLNMTIDVLLYVDRLDVYRVDDLDKQVVTAITDAFGKEIWKKSALVLSHAQFSPPDGLNYDLFVSRRSDALLKLIRASAQLKKQDMQDSSIPVILVENSGRCHKNESDEKILPDGTSWIPNLYKTITEICFNGNKSIHVDKKLVEGPNPNARGKRLIPLIFAFQYLLVMQPLVRAIKSDVSRESKPAWEMRESDQMSASTMSLTATPSKRTPIVAGDKKSNFDFPPSESLANGEAKDPILAEAVTDRSKGQDLGPVTRRVSSTTNTTSATQRRTRKAAAPRSEKARWKRVARIFAKQLVALLIIVGLIQAARKVLSPSSSSSPTSSFETEMAFSGLESRIAEVDGLVKATTSTMQVQVELLDKKIEKEAKALRQELEAKASAFHNELRKIESRTESLEKSVEEVNAKPFVSRDEFERVYEELKKGNVDDSAFSEVSIDELRAYARDMMEKEIEKHAADGLGRVDHALASGGGFVMGHSEPYLVGKGSSWFATTGRKAHTNAVKMLSPSFGEPGQCFALKGSSGYVQIRLRGPIVPEAFTLEHVAKSVAYDRSSAPKDCVVSGWLQGKGQESSEETEKMQLLTEFTYDLERSNAQTFNVLDSSDSGLVDTVRLDFTSNHGSNSHTCIYRFRVHGRAPDPVPIVETEL